MGIGQGTGRWIAAVIVAAALGVAGRADAATITLQPIGPDAWLSRGNPAGDDTALLATVQAAADTWSAALRDSRQFVGDVGFTYRLPTAVRGAEGHRVPADPTSTKVIGFNSHPSWFFDPTPFDNSEYTTESLTSSRRTGERLNRRSE